MNEVNKMNNLPEGWEWLPLGELASVSAGNPAPQGDDKFENGIMPFVRVKDMGKLSGKALLKDVSDHVNSLGAKNLNLFRKGSVLFTKSGASTLLNQRAILGQDSYIVSHIAVAEPNDGILSEWIYYWMKTIDFAKLAHGANMPSLPLSKIKAISVPVAPPEQQKQIVANIEKLFSHINSGVEALNKAKELLKLYRQSVLKAAFTGQLTSEWREANGGNTGDGENQDGELPEDWSIQPLVELVKPTRPRVRPSDYPDLPFLGLEHIEAHTMKLLGSVSAGSMKSTAFHFQPGDVLYGRLRPYLNKVYRVDFEGFCSSEFIVLPESNRLDGKYLQYFLNTTQFIKYATGLNSGDRPRVKFDQFSSFRIPLPPPEQQKKIVSEIEQIFSHIASTEESINKIDQMLNKNRQSILHEAFTGEILNK